MSFHVKSEANKMQREGQKSPAGIFWGHCKLEETLKNAFRIPLYHSQMRVLSGVGRCWRPQDAWDLGCILGLCHFDPHDFQEIARERFSLKVPQDPKI